MAAPLPKESRSTIQQSSLLPWILTILVTLLALYVWAHSFRWHLSHLNTYQVFPLFGLLAFSIMWSHYMAGTMKRLFLKSAELSTYFRVTGYAVLLAIVLHPGLLIYQLFRDGYGLPPHSYETYVQPGLGWVTLLGSVSFLAFIAFEFHRWFRDRSWWKYIIYAGDGAMVAIFYHGLRLGDQLYGGWYRGVWFFYGLTLILAIVFKYIVQFRTARHAPLDSQAS